MLYLSGLHGAHTLSHAQRMLIALPLGSRNLFALFERERAAFSSSSLSSSVHSADCSFIKSAREHAFPFNASATHGAGHVVSHRSRRLEVPNVPAGSTSSDAFTSLPKRQTGREAGTQSNGSLRDCRATEEAPSADEPRVATMFGEEELV